jgi:hypothetical protein
MSPGFNNKAGSSDCMRVKHRRRNAKVIPRETPGGGS